MGGGGGWFMVRTVLLGGSQRFPRLVREGDGTPIPTRRRIMQGIRTKVVTVAAVGAAIAGGAAFANAATSGSTSSNAATAPQGAAPGRYGGPQGFDPHKGGHTANGRTETLLSGATASKVRAA